MKRDDREIELTSEQEVEAAYIEDILAAKAKVEVRYMARLMASKPNRELFGATEFQLRNAVHRLGANGIDAALAAKKKRVIKDQAVSVRPANKTPSSNVTEPPQ